MYLTIDSSTHFCDKQRIPRVLSRRGSFAAHPSSEMLQASTSVPHLCMELVKKREKEQHVSHGQLMLFLRCTLVNDAINTSTGFSILLLARTLL